MISPELSVSLVAPTMCPDVERSFVHAALPRRLNRLAFYADRYFPASEALGKRRYAQELARADIAYLWAGVPYSVYREVKARGIPLVVERINCHRRTAKRLLEEAYERVGIPTRLGFTEASIDEEEAKLALADFVFVPSPAVRASMLDAGVPGEKLLSASYGFCPQRIPAPRERPEGAPFTVAFVGTLCVRKGVHVLLEAWERAAIPGAKLILCGELEEGLKKRCAGWLARPDVDYRGFLANVGEVYGGADVLVLPSVEEGSPLVVYEAMGAGVVPVVSPMAGGEIVRNGVDGCVVGAFAVDQLAGALCRLAEDSALLRRMKTSSAARARNFVWSKVAARRRALLLDVLAESRREHEGPARLSGFMGA